MNFINRITKPVILSVFLLFFQSLQAMPPPISFTAKHPIFSKDNTKLIYLNSQNNRHAYKIIQMNTKTGKVIKTVPVKSLNGLSAFAATPDGFKVLAMNPHGFGVIHNGTGKLLRMLPHPSKIKDWRFTPVQSHDGVLLAIPSIGPPAQKIFLIHTGSGKVIRSIDVSSKKKTADFLPIIRSIGFNQDRHKVAYLQQDKNSSSLHIYDIYQENEILIIKLPKPYYDYGKITFSKNGQNILLYNYGTKGITLVDIIKQSVKTLNYDNSSFVGFTADDKNIIIIQPFANSVSIQNIATGVVKRHSIKLKTNEGDYGWRTVQSADRTKLALPFKTQNYAKIDRFLILDGNMGQLIRELKAKKL